MKGKNLDKNLNEINDKNFVNLNSGNELENEMENDNTFKVNYFKYTGPNKSQVRNL